MLAYSDAGCTNQQLGPIRSPGIANLNVAATVAFNDHISSFKSVIHINPHKISLDELN
jgi:hypothetical protein